MKKRMMFVLVMALALVCNVSWTADAYTLSKATPCQGVENGSEPYQKVPVGAATVFEQGNEVYGFVELLNVCCETMNFRWELSFNGTQYNELTNFWRPDGTCWSKAYLYNQLASSVAVGEYEARIFASIDGGEYFYLTSISFEGRRTQPLNSPPYLEDFEVERGWILEDFTNSDPENSFLDILQEGGFENSGCMAITNWNAPGESWEVRAKLPGFLMEKGKKYWASLRFRSDSPCGKIKMKLSSDVPPNNNLGLYAESEVFTEWKKLSATFTVEGSDGIDPANIRLVVDAGEISGTLYVDDIQIIEESGAPHEDEDDDQVDGDGCDGDDHHGGHGGGGGCFISTLLAP